MGCALDREAAILLLRRTRVLSRNGKEEVAEDVVAKGGSNQEVYQSATGRGHRVEDPERRPITPRTRRLR